MDRISQLPESIVHHILSLIDSPDWYALRKDWNSQLVGMSVLSKHWFHLTASFPILNFYIHNFTNVSRQSVFKYVDYATSRFCNQNLTAHAFKLITTLEDPAELDIVTRCLELVLKNGVRELEIYITNLSGSPRLPDLLLSASVLKCLRIGGCELPSSLMADVVQFKSLIRLELRYVDIDDEAIKTLATSCARLRVFEISNCHGLKRFCVYGHQHLQEVFIIHNGQVEMIDIEAPNLSTLFVADWDGRGAPQMNLSSCKKLTTVTYFGYPLPNSNGFTDFLSNFPFIEILVLLTTYKGNNLKLSSHSLRALVLHSKYDLEDIEFRTPNLDLFIYSCSYCAPYSLIGNILRLWPILGKSTHLKACMQCYSDRCIDALWFQKLRQFLDKKNGFKVLNLYIRAPYCQKFSELEKLKAIELPPYELEHVELQLGTLYKSSLCIAFVDAAVWCCRPQSLTLKASFSLADLDEQSDIVKFTYEKLLQQEDEGHTNVQIMLPSSSKAQKQCQMSFPWTLPREGKAISFIKERTVNSTVDIEII